MLYVIDNNDLIDVISFVETFSFLTYMHWISCEGEPFLSKYDCRSQDLMGKPSLNFFLGICTHSMDMA